jgi:hypothetical protein
MDAMVVLAEAVSKGDSRRGHVYFDIATNVTARSSATDAAFVAARMRQIGLPRILYGSDMATGGNATAQDSWKALRDNLASPTLSFAPSPITSFPTCRIDPKTCAQFHRNLAQPCDKRRTGHDEQITFGRKQQLDAKEGGYVDSWRDRRL